MERVIPVLQIDDYEIALEFYVRRLGFSVLFEHRHEPGFPVYMVVEHGNLTLGLSEHGRGHQGSEVYIIVSDVQFWHDRCLAHDLAIEDGPRKMPWGNTEMLIKDPSRNAIRFTQQQTHAGHGTPNSPKTNR